MMLRRARRPGARPPRVISAEGQGGPASDLATPRLEWCAPQSQPALAVDLVHVWRADLDVEAARASSWHRSLSADERARGARFRFARDHGRFITGRGLLRAILAQYLHTPPGRLSLHQGTHGKPFVAGHDDLRFNVSHAGATLLVAVAYRREVGIDIEQIDNDLPVEELADTTLSPAEVRILDAFPHEARQAAFLRLWTRKEAYLKADGRGMSLPVTSVDVSAPGGAVALRDEPTGEWEPSMRWMLQTPAVGPEHVAALAAEGRDWRFTCFQWPGAREERRGTRASSRLVSVRHRE